MGVHEGAPIEEGIAGQDHEAFRRCLSQYATGVTIITTGGDGRPAGMTSNSFSSLSMTPPLVVWSIRRESRSFETFRNAGNFAVNVLSVKQLDLAKVFARSGADKFAGVSWEPGLGSSPILEGVVASLECARAGETDGGDHVMLMGRVERFRRYDRAPLLFAQGRYGRIYDVSDSDSGILDKMNLPTEASKELTTSLMFKAYRATLRLFEKARRLEELSYPEVLLLTTVRRHPGSRIEALISKSAFDLDAGRDLASRLIARQLLELSEDGLYDLTAEGIERLDRIVRNSTEMREDVFKDLPQAELDAALRVLNEIVSRGAQSR